MSVAAFEWDAGNIAKCQKHGVTIAEIESLLRDPTLTFDDKPNDAGEVRFKAIGITHTGRNAFVVYMFREKLGRRVLRPISARFMHKKEVKAYEEKASPPRK